MGSLHGVYILAALRYGEGMAVIWVLTPAEADALERAGNWQYLDAAQQRDLEARGFIANNHRLTAWGCLALLCHTVKQWGQSREQ